MNRITRASLVCLVLGGAVGCAGRTENQRQVFGLPQLFAGPSQIQRERATQFDPYPDQDMGPEVVGGRPLDYNRQIPEVERSRFVGRSAQPVSQEMKRWRPNNMRVVPRMPATPPGAVVVPPPAPGGAMAPGGAIGPTGF
ncbi:MAG: hypothetical protein K2Y37_10370 [Pirellulales bacterium]|nr:hypothetical protein [Pirellulales bacterium]